MSRSGLPGATVRHLLAHASGLGPEGGTPISAPERTRIYSNAGYDLLGALLEERSGQPIATVLENDVLEPLGMSGDAAHRAAPRSGCTARSTTSRASAASSCVPR